MTFNDFQQFYKVTFQAISMCVCKPFQHSLQLLKYLHAHIFITLYQMLFVNSILGKIFDVRPEPIINIYLLSFILYLGFKFILF